MGQKIHPYGLRLGIIKTWQSIWFADRKKYALLLHEDIAIRSLIKERLQHAAVSRIEIERTPLKVRVNIYTARPGIIIGRKGTEVERLKKVLAVKTDKQVFINIKEVKSPDMEAQLIAENVASQLEKRISFRRAMKRPIQSALAVGALGVKICVAGRLGGSEMSRTEWYREGRVPLHTLRADIDYGFATARTKAGSVGVKVWVYKGEILDTSVLRKRDEDGA